MTSLFTTETKSPIGTLTLFADDEALVAVHMRGRSLDGAQKTRRHPILERALRQLEEYFAKERKRFDLPLAPRGTAFQLAVWKGLVEIGFGVTRSYGELARHVGKPSASRAVGGANNRNPISIIIPCHRVIGAGGDLVGYGGGIEQKRWLLAHEGALSL